MAVRRLSVASHRHFTGRSLSISSNLSQAAVGVAQSAAALKRPASVALPAPLASTRKFSGAAASTGASGNGAGGAPPPPSGARPGASQVLPRRALENQRPMFASGGPGTEPEGLDDNTWEFEGTSSRGTASPEPSVMRGRLREKFSFWKSRCRSRTVLQWIAVGFPLLWLAAFPNGPASVFQRNHPSALNQQVGTSAIKAKTRQNSTVR